ncbi:hypothetical protein BASA81_000488 [Batrachochytrium salamandrivorans]|nr:hypothetical protein BASA81_000488 [Batrachochytrium salamandrivorans]
MSSSLVERRPAAVGGHSQPQTWSSLMPPSIPRSRVSPPRRLTWKFTFGFILTLCLFFVMHVEFSKYMRPGAYVGRQWTRPVVVAPVSVRSANIKRILVMGSHHTGTSIVTRLIMEMGVNAGDNLLMLPGNELKYNEHRLAVEANKRVLSKGHDPSKRRRGPSWVDYGFDYKFVRQEERDLFSSSITKVYDELDRDTRDKQKTSWVIKDPRLSLLAKHWLEPLPSSNTVCVLVVRDAMETSVRLAKNYNKPGGGSSSSLHIWEWIQVWEESMLTAAHYCKQLGMKIVFAHHRELMKSAFVFAQRLEMDLFQTTNTFHSQQVVDGILGRGFAATGGFSRPPELAVWLPHTRQLMAALQTEHLQSLPPLTWLHRGARHRHDKEAYATIITGDNKGFVAGAIALAASIRQFDTKRTLVAMLSPEVDPLSSNLEALRLAGWELLAVDKLEEPWYQTHEKCREFTDSQQVRWGRMFTKLRVYSLLQFDHVLYVDTDVIALRELDYYFALDGGQFYGERSPSHLGINAGIMVIRPSHKILQRMITYARVNEPRVFWPGHQVGCTEQELVNRFWNAELPSRKLNNTRHFDYLGAKFTTEVGREEIALEGARLAHCLTTKCFKPWEVAVERLLKDGQGYDVNAIQANCDPIMYLTWYSNYMSDAMAPARLALDAAEIGTGSTLLAVNTELSLLVGKDGENLKRNWNTPVIRQELKNKRLMAG